MYILMISPNNFPNGDAGAIRDEHFARIYQKIGYDVVYIGMGTKNKQGIYKNIKFFSLYRSNFSLIKKIKNRLSYKKRLKEIFESIKFKLGNPALIHIYDLPKDGITWAKEYAIQNMIPIIHDSVEWYSPCEFKMKCFAYPYLLKNRTNKKLINKPIAVIAISSYLEKYFKSKGLNVIRIPVIMDSKEYIAKKERKKDKIKIIYAGSPAKKDYLRECVIAFNMLDTEIKSKFKFFIFGVDNSYIESYCNGVIPKEIVSYGRMPREYVLDQLEESDFSLLLRPAHERYTKAGFPTKSVEAMMNSCAMICNLTSDLDKYLKDGINFICVKDCTVNSMKEAFIKVSKLTFEEINMIKTNARITAIQNFDYMLYIESIKTLIKKAQHEINDYNY